MKLPDDELACYQVALGSIAKLSEQKETVDCDSYAGATKTFCKSEDGMFPQTNFTRLLSTDMHAEIPAVRSNGII